MVPAREAPRAVAVRYARPAMSSDAVRGPTRMTSLNEILQRHVDSGTIPGAVALVDRAGAVEVETAGVMTLGEPAAMPRDAIMRLASITKPIVAAATARKVT